MYYIIYCIKHNMHNNKCSIFYKLSMYIDRVLEFINFKGRMTIWAADFSILNRYCGMKIKVLTTSPYTSNVLRNIASEYLRQNRCDVQSNVWFWKSGVAVRLQHAGARPRAAALGARRTGRVARGLARSTQHIAPACWRRSNNVRLQL